MAGPDLPGDPAGQDRAGHHESLTARTCRLMREHDLQASKSLGQNFLIDDNLARRIADEALSFRPDGLIEIGPGLGALTVLLAESGLPLTACEKDTRLRPALEELVEGFPGVSLAFGDFLEMDLSPGPNTVAVGNLPYYITTPILEKLFGLTPPLRGIVVTVQQEVASRIQAGPADGKDYGSLTVFCRYYAERIERVCALPPTVFLPQPGVQSVALAIHPRPEPPGDIASTDHFFRAVRAAFGYRRKTLRKALEVSPRTALDRSLADRVLQVARIDGGRRGEALSFEEFIRLGNALAAVEADR